MADAFDVIVIGGGSGGSGFARRAAGYGKKVVLIDRGVARDGTGKRQGAGLGGTCVNVGCVPKKLMFMATHHREVMHGKTATAPGFGFTVPESAAAFDWAGFKARRDAYVARLNGIYHKNWTGAGIEVVLGYAKFKSDHEVEVALNDGGTKTFTAPHVVVAVGGVPSPLGAPGQEHVIDSDDFFDIAEQPKKALVVGAGYIAVEMAGILGGLGTPTTLMCRGDTVLRHGFDPFIVETLMKELRAHGPELVTNASVAKVELAADGTKTVTTQDGRALEGFDTVLTAIGRVPTTDALGLENTKVEVTDKGLIRVDKYENTTSPGVYAIGDVTTHGYDLTPVAIAAGRRLADRVFGGEPRARLGYADVATVVFSHPPIGTVGLTEPQAKERFGEENVWVRQARFASMAFSMNPDDGKVMTAMKLVLKMPERRVVGLHIIGPSSDEMLQGFAVAVRMGATLDDFEASVAIHPTISEELVTFGGWGQVKDLSMPGGMRPVLPPYLRDEDGDAPEGGARL